MFVIGCAVHDGEYSRVTINGKLQPAAQTFRAGTTYRLRFINISPDATVELALVENGVPHRWIGLANDGAVLPPSLRLDRVARLRFGPGQTYDFSWKPTSPGNATLILDWPLPTEPGNLVLRQSVSCALMPTSHGVRAADSYEAPTSPADDIAKAARTRSRCVSELAGIGGRGMPPSLP